MAVNSINSNIAAYYAQANISSNSTNVSLSVSRLSSGNRIVRASDDVAGLSIGTSLRTNVSTLRVAKLNTSLGGSLLQVADGALAQVVEILQRQKSISTQAASGSLTSTERAYLDQEFQALTLEVDRIVDSTNFNGVKLLNGALAAQIGLVGNTQDGNAASVAAAAAIVTIAAGNAANNDRITINGVTVDFTTSLPGTSGAVGKVTIGAANTGTAANLAAFLNNLGDPRLANLTFEASAGTLLVNWAGGVLAGSHTVTLTEVTDGGGTLTVANGAIAAAGSNGLGVDRTSALGAVTGSILVNGGATTVTQGKAIDTSNVLNSVDFLGKLNEGKIGKITATYTTTDTASFTLKVGDLTYTTTATDIVDANAVTLTFTGQDITGAQKGGTFTIGIRGAAVTTFDTQTELDGYVAQVNEALAGVTFVQNRDIKSFQNGEVVSISGVQTANLVGFQADLRSDNFTSVNLESIKVTAPAVGTTDAKFEVVIDGETYTSISGIGNQIGLNALIALQSTTDSNKVITFTTGNTAIAGSTTVALDIATQAKADVLQTALERAFGLHNGGAKVNFQVGTLNTDTLGVKISDVNTSVLFAGASLNVLTATAATTAGTALDTAIQLATAARANVGALQSRFNFAAANIDSSVQNQDAARGELLDTDIASESTAFSISQVKLQAGISTLAQANQQLQTLLKLIG